MILSSKYAFNSQRVVVRSQKPAYHKTLACVSCLFVAAFNFVWFLLRPHFRVISVGCVPLSHIFVWYTFCFCVCWKCPFCGLSRFKIVSFLYAINLRRRKEPGKDIGKVLINTNIIKINIIIRLTNLHKCISIINLSSYK